MLDGKIVYEFSSAFGNNAINKIPTLTINAREKM